MSNITFAVRDLSCVTSCEKTLAINQIIGCGFDTCQTQPPVPLIEQIDNGTRHNVAYSDTSCYCIFLTHSADYTKQYWNRYHPETNTYSQRGVLAGAPLSPSNIVWDSLNDVFVFVLGTDVVIIDPLVDTVPTIYPSAGMLWDLLYVPEKQKIYGLDNTTMYSLDVSTSGIVALGTFAHRPYELAYSPTADALYGPWITGMSSGIMKFNLISNLSVDLIGISGTTIAWDPIRFVMLVTIGSALSDLDTATDTWSNTYSFPADYDLRWNLEYDADSDLFFLEGYDVGNNHVLYQYDPVQHVATLIKNDYQYKGKAVVGPKQLVALGEDIGTAAPIVRDLCFNSLPTAYWKFDEANGDRLDSMGNQWNTLTNVGADPGSAAGIINNGIPMKNGDVFNPVRLVSDIGAAHRTQLPFNTTGPGMTWCLWVKWNATPGSSNRAAPYISMWELNPMLRIWDNLIEVQFQGKTIDSTLSSPFPFVAGQWYFIAYQFRTSNLKVRFSVNAGAWNEAANVADVAGADTHTQYMEFDTIGQPDCVIDEMGVWCNQVLTDAEIAYLYNSGTGRSLPI